MNKLSEIKDIEDNESIRKSFKDQGYVYIKSFFDPGDVIEARDLIFNILKNQNWGKIENNKIKPIGKINRILSINFINTIECIMRKEKIHLLSYNKKLNSFIKTLLQEEIFTHPRKMIRISYPYKANPSDLIPPHQDIVYVKGEVDTLISWIPLGSYPPESGGLQVAHGSHKHGLFPVKANEEGRFGCAASNLKKVDLDWRAGNYSIGDLLVMHSLTLHKAGKNMSPHFRISLDFRYSSSSGYINEEQLLPPYYPKVSSWKKITKNWDNRELFLPPETLKIDSKNKSLKEIMKRKSIFI